MNSQLPPGQKLKEIFQRYGKVRAILMRQNTPTTQSRPHVFLDYFEHESAQKALIDMTENDLSMLKKMEVGDKSLEIIMAIKKRCKNFSNPQMQQTVQATHSTVSNQNSNDLQYQN
mmetsp:Transcript_37914/g.36322  ORF Transcript_37914/g.36322 Transcript_37914/m.36322 type:complete len:116 (+) Transcript_37914:1103-1450(+)